MNRRQLADSSCNFFVVAGREVKLRERPNGQSPQQVSNFLLFFMFWGKSLFFPFSISSSITWSFTTVFITRNIKTSKPSNPKVCLSGFVQVWVEFRCFLLLVLFQDTIVGHVRWAWPNQVFTLKDLQYEELKQDGGTLPCVSLARNTHIRWLKFFATRPTATVAAEAQWVFIWGLQIHFSKLDELKQRWNPQITGIN